MNIFVKLRLSKTFFARKIDELREIKESRNLLLHNNLKVNDFYKTKAGPCIRESIGNGILKIDIKYLQETIVCIQYFIDQIDVNLMKKYKKYTKVFLLKSTWESFFHSPIMKLEDFWGINKEKDTVFSLKKCKYEGSLSSGETSLLSL